MKGRQKALAKIFDITIYLIIFWIIIWWYIGVFYILKSNMDLDLENLDNKLYLTIAAIIFFQCLIVVYVISVAYKSPIAELKNQIINFLNGSSRWNEVKIKTNFLNPSINISLIFFDSVLSSLRNIKDEFLSWKAIKWEVELAMEIQEKLLKKKPENIPSLDVIARSKPAWEIWWDSFDIIKWWWDSYYIYVWDATGHGVGAGFVMVMVNALVSRYVRIFKKWSHILGFTNEILKPRIKSNILMSLLLIRWDEKEKRLFMTWAWHEYLIIYKNSNQKCYKLKSGWLALWLTKNIHKILKEQEVKFEQNDIVVLYTDGITEAINQNKKDWNEQMFSEQRLIDAIVKAQELPWTNTKTARSVFNSITMELSKFMWYNHKQYDDITLVVVHNKWNQLLVDNTPIEIPSEFITEWNWDN